VREFGSTGGAFKKKKETEGEVPWASVMKAETGASGKMLGVGRGMGGETGPSGQDP